MQSQMDKVRCEGRSFVRALFLEIIRAESLLNLPSWILMPSSAWSMPSFLLQLSGVRNAIRLGFF